MKQVFLKDLKKGDFFTLKDYGEFPDDNKVYIRGEYERSEKKYSCGKFSDWNYETFKKGTTKVYVGFTF